MPLDRPPASDFEIAAPLRAPPDAIDGEYPLRVWIVPSISA